MKILVVNCNTSAATTRTIGIAARQAAAEGTTVEAVQPEWGVESAEGYLDSFLSAAAVLDLLNSDTRGADAVVLAGYGEHGREGARQLLTIPVVDITEASAQLACLLGHRFGVVTTLASTVAGITDSLTTAGLSSRCVAVTHCDLPVLGLHADLAATARTLAERGRPLIEDGADVLVLGCAGMAGLDRAVEDILGVPVVEGVSAAIGVAEVLVRLGKSTSKAGPYAPPLPHKRRQFRP
ncbi:aspartate/glutamate racemase family protein [Microlunatus sp. GCM10028923]|uniref:aspartate/glutamate racemase family protein n=1 Tax=Microlunatus sp. GCM10028923 TaxID=3273400 RepID=UPI0036106503